MALIRIAHRQPRDSPGLVFETVFLYDAAVGHAVLPSKYEVGITRTWLGQSHMQ